MRKVLTAVVVGALSGAAMLAVAANPVDNAPETRAYFNLNFGGARDLPSNFHYGLRLDRDSRYSALRTPVLQMEMNQAGVLNARFNGVNLLRRSLIVHQDEAAPEAAAEVAAEGTAEAATASAASGTAYSAADWGLIILGGAGVAYAGYEVSKSGDDDIASGNNGGSTAGGSTTGGSTTGGSTTGGSTTGGSTTGIPLLGLADMEKLSLNAERQSSEYREWLDGGSGQMGDLSVAR